MSSNPFADNLHFLDFLQQPGAHTPCCSPRPSISVSPRSEALRPEPTIGNSLLGNLQPPPPSTSFALLRRTVPSHLLKDRALEWLSCSISWLPCSELGDPRCWSRHRLSHAPMIEPRRAPGHTASSRSEPGLHPVGPEPRTVCALCHQRIFLCHQRIFPAWPIVLAFCLFGIAACGKFRTFGFQTPASLLLGGFYLASETSQRHFRATRRPPFIYLRMFPSSFYTGFVFFN